MKHSHQVYSALRFSSLILAFASMTALAQGSKGGDDSTGVGGSPNPGINAGANQAADDQKRTANVNLVASGAFWVAWAGCSGACPTLAMMGATTALQAATTYASYRGSKKVRNRTNNNGNPNGNGGPEFDWPIPEEDVPPPFRADLAAINRGVDAFKKKGGKIDKNGITLPNGKRYSTKEAGSLAGLTAEGATSEDLLAAHEMSKKAEASADSRWAKYSANVVSMGTAGGGGGGSAGGRAKYKPTKFGSGLDAYFKALRGGQKSKKSQAAGKSLLVGGVPVGVKADNLFDMVHRRYQSKAQYRVFIEGRPGGQRQPRLRRPASNRSKRP